MMHNRGLILHINETSEEAYGGKAHGLRRLATIGLNIPDSYVVHHDWTNHIDRDRYLRAFMEKSGDGPFAVRSSGAAEDGRFLSAAGQYRTYLDVRGFAPLSKAISDCFSSTEDENVHEYRNRMGVGDRNGMSVVIQPMIRAQKAGVVFTVDPVSGETDRLVIEAVAGLGEPLVTGRTYSGQYHVSRTTRAILDRPANEQRELLQEEEIGRLVTEALKAEASWGVPLDLEWAIDREGALVWLQARPITTLNDDSLDTPLSCPTELLTRANIGEMFPGAATPLTLSVFGECLDWGLWKMYRKMGALTRGEKPRFIYHFQNQFFMSLTAMYCAARRVAGATRENVEMNLLGRVLPDHDIGKPSSKLVRAVNGLKYFYLVLGHKRYLRRIDRTATRFRLEIGNLSAEDAYGQLIRHQKTVLNKVFFYHYAVSAFSGVMNSVLALMLSGGREITDEGQSLMSSLLADIEGVESANVVKSLDALADRIAACDRADWFIKADTHDALLWLADERPAGLLFRDFLKRHGHRSIREAELREKDWASVPENLIVTLREMTEIRRQEPARVNARNARTSDPSPLPPEQTLTGAVKRVLSLAKKGVGERELSKARFILAEHQFKLGYRRLGQLLSERNLIPDSDLVYFMTKEEIGELMAGKGERLIALAIRRRKKYPEQMSIQFPELCHGVPTEAVAEKQEAASSYAGTPVSPGVAEGRVRIVTSIDDARKLRPNEIMVASFTDIGWTPYYGIIMGLITELGGALSHGAVVAREYGLPLVSNIPGITSLLSDGQLIRMDGQKGSIEVLR